MLANWENNVNSQKGCMIDKEVPEKVSLGRDSGSMVS